MKIKKYPHGGVHRPVAESTSVQMPDPRALQALEDAERLSSVRRQEEINTLGYPASYGSSVKSVNPLFDILSIGGPKFFSQVGKAGIKQIAKFIGNTPKSQLDNMAPRDIVLKALDPMDELAERRAKENLEFVSERAIKQAGAEDSGALINLQSRSDALLDDAMAKEISERLRLGRQADDIFSQALVDDVAKVRDVGDIKDLQYLKSTEAGLDFNRRRPEYQKLFEDLGLTKDEASELLRDRALMDPDAMKLDLTSYGKTNLGGQPGERFVRSIRSNGYGGVVPKKKKKKGMRVKKR